MRVACVDVAVALALAPLPVRGQEVVSVCGGHRPRRSLLVVALGVEALGRVVTALAPRSDIGHGVTALDGSERVPLPAGGEQRDRSRSHALPSRSHDRLQAGDYLPLLPACGPKKQDGWPDEESRRV